MMVAFKIFMGDKLDLEKLRGQISSYSKVYQLVSDETGERVERDYTEKNIMNPRKEGISFMHIYPRTQLQKEYKPSKDDNIEVHQYTKVVIKRADVVIFKFGKYTVFLVNSNHSATGNMLDRTLKECCEDYERCVTTIDNDDLIKIRNVQMSLRSEGRVGDGRVEKRTRSGTLSVRNPDDTMDIATEVENDDAPISKMSYITKDKESVNLSVAGTVKVTCPRRSAEETEEYILNILKYVKPVVRT